MSVEQKDQNWASSSVYWLDFAGLGLLENICKDKS